MLMAFAARFGGFGAFLEIIISAMLGVYVLSNYPKALLKGVQSQWYQGQVTRQMVFSSLRGMLGALFLILPGLGTDIVGLIMAAQLLILSLFSGNGFDPSFQQTQERRAKKPWNNSPDGNQFEEAWEGDKFDEKRHDESPVQGEVIDVTPDKKTEE